jgi:hypothetical protein
MVRHPSFSGGIGPGRHASARFFCALFPVALLLAALPAQGQQRQQPRQQAQPATTVRQAPVSLPVPDETSLAKLIWSTMAAVDHANKTGNYSVLRDLGSAGFQTNNNAATLAAVFAGLRTQQVDLTNTLAVTPAYEIPPQMVQANVLRLRGSFNMRPAPVQFDLMFEWNGGWRLEGVAIRTAPVASPPR